MQKLSQTPTQSTSDPFTILYNFRKKPKQRQKPRRKSSACERHYQIPEFTMRTRKMTAEIELKHELEMHEKAQAEDQIGQQNPQPEMKLDQDQQFLLVNEEQLQNIIPLSPEAEKEILYNYAQNSQISSYSKLEKALFDFSLEGGSMEIE